MIRVSRQAFEAMVQEAVEDLPEALRLRMSNLALLVRDEPDPGDLREAREAGEDDSEGLFGLYRGVPLPERDSTYDKVLPDVITIYQATHEEVCDSLEELREEIGITVRHEVAHHFGIDDDRLEELDAY